MRSRNLAVTLFISIICVVFALSVWAAWINQGVKASSGDGVEIYPYIASDDAGGAYIAWEQSFENPFFNNSIFVNRIDSNGNLPWGIGGISLTPDTTIAWSPVDIAPDGAGGALVCWTDGRDALVNSRDIYAQRLDANGNHLWTYFGAEVYAGPEEQDYPLIVSDSTGGAVIVWRDNRNSNDDLRAQRLDASGSRLWSHSGVVVCSDPSDQHRHQIVSDGAGGVIVTWDDNRSGSNDIYAQRVDSNGVVQWTIDGLPIRTEIGKQQIRAQLVSDGDGGAIITWQEPTRILYAQRVNADGDTLWPTPGAVIFDYYVGGRSDPQIASVSGGGAVLCWNDARSPRGIYAQRIDADGDTLWNGDGVKICEAIGTQEEIRIASDGGGGAAISWQENRQSGDAGDVYARTVDASGTPQGPNNGTALCTSISEQRFIGIATDEAGGGIVTWSDNRDYEESASDIYASRIKDTGATGIETPESPRAGFLSQNFPNPFNPSTTILYKIDEPGPVSLRIYDAAGHLVSVLVDGKRDAMQHTATWNGRDLRGRSVASGVYFYRLTAPGFEKTRKMVLLQ
jgi:hypothetical protein